MIHIYFLPHLIFRIYRQTFLCSSCVAAHLLIVVNQKYQPKRKGSHNLPWLIIAKSNATISNSSSSDAHHKTANAQHIILIRHRARSRACSVIITIRARAFEQGHYKKKPNGSAILKKYFIPTYISKKKNNARKCARVRLIRVRSGAGATAVRRRVCVIFPDAIVHLFPSIFLCI